MSDEHDESSLYEGLIGVFPQDYASDTFSETDSGKLQVLVKLLAAIHELNPSERQVQKRDKREIMGYCFAFLMHGDVIFKIKVLQLFAEVPRMFIHCTPGSSLFNY